MKRFLIAATAALTVGFASHPVARASETAAASTQTVSEFMNATNEVCRAEECR
jgi:hypothetical protein